VSGRPLWRHLRGALAPVLLAVVPAIGGAAPADAQALRGLQGGNAPLEINADDGIEWRRDEQVYIARGNALAVRGDISVYADEMRAHYRKIEGAGTDVDIIDVLGNVRIVSPTATIYGDRGAYDVINGVLVLVGKDLRLIGEHDTLTARDSLEYWEKKKIAVARGDAEAVREDKRIKADVLTAYFKPGADDGLDLDRIEAFGNVRIVTAQEYVQGNHGIYFVEKEIATLDGDVKITREDNQLNGAYAEVNLKTGISQLLAGPPGSPKVGRVRGLLVPKRKPTPGGES